MPEQQPTTETVTLASAGSIPGIPGQHGPGTYLVDWLKRTATPVVGSIIDRVEQPVHPEPVTSEQVQ